MTTTSTCRAILGIAATLVAPLAAADHHLFEFEQIYSDATGKVQFIVMHQTPPTDGEDKWANTRILVTNRDTGAVKGIFINTDLPSSSTADRRVLIGSQSFAALGLIKPDYTMPDGTLPLKNTWLGWADFIFDYPALPTDGKMALDGLTLQPTPNVATNFSGASASIAPAVTPPPGATKVRVVEYYNASLDHYFITPLAAEQAVLDAGVTIKGWVRTGEGFNVYTTAESGTSAVCRYYMPPEFGNSHFFGRGTVECDATGKKNPGFVLEDPKFMYVYLPTNGTCATGQVPIYRVFDNRADANHRYMTSSNVRSAMVSSGWVAEGDGPDLVVMCAVP